MAKLIFLQDIVWDGTVSRGGQNMFILQWMRGLEYTIDPEGSVSIIDMRRGASGLRQSDVRTAGFVAFNAPPNGVKLDPSIRIFGPGATVAQDIEPEYLTVSNDSRTAWVTCQENNALASSTSLPPS